MRIETAALQKRGLATGALIALLWVGLSVSQGTGVDLPSALLPPESDPADCGALVSHYWGGQPSSYGTLGVDFGTLSLKCFQSVSRESIGLDERQTYTAMLVTTASFGGGSPVPTTLVGPMETVVTDRILSTTGLFSAEITGMSLSGDAGGTPVSLRESPSMASIGEINITDLGGGIYHIDSFFDVFTELSVDGGQTWSAVNATQILILYSIDTPVSLESFRVE